MKKTNKKTEIKRISMIMEATDPNFKKRFDPDVESDFQMETKDGEYITFTVEGESQYGDSGIGSYEFWGQRGHDSRPGFELGNYQLKDDSYDPQYKEEIEEWIKTHGMEIVDKLDEILSERDPEDYFGDFDDRDE